MTTPSLAVCVTTRDRPDELERCLRAIFAGEVTPKEVIVSDDSRHPGRTLAVTARFPGVRYVRPHAEGSGAARNAAARAATATHVSFVDDDAVVARDFVSGALELVATLDGATVVTGAVREGYRLLTPKNPTFLGHHEKEPDGDYRNIHFNSNIFPRTALLSDPFDEAIEFSHDEVDLAAGLLAGGYRIVYAPHLVNRHAPPPRSQDDQRRRHRRVRRWRFYVGLKRYAVWERRPLVALAFLVAAPLHQAAHELRGRRLREVPRTFVDMALGVRDVTALYLRRRRATPA
jgi:GT2 family glycosyltransferase